MGGAILVTGASGFIGRHLTARLQRDGRRLAPLRRIEMEAETDWSSALADVDSVIHLAALAHARAEAAERARDYETLRRVNALGTQRLANAAARAGVRRFVFVSTIGVHGERTGPTPFTEQSPFAPRSLYAASKLEAEELLASLASPSSLTVTVLRPTLTYGPGNGGNMVRLLRLIERGWPLPFGAVRNRRSMTSVHNLVSAIISVLDRAGPPETFVVCDGAALSTGEIARHLAEGMQRRVRMLPVPVAALRAAGCLLGQQARVGRLVDSLEADCGKLARVTGWRPLIEPSDGLRQTGAWFEREGTGSG